MRDFTNNIKYVGKSDPNSYSVVFYINNIAFEWKFSSADYDDFRYCMDCIAGNKGDNKELNVEVSKAIKLALLISNQI